MDRVSYLNGYLEKKAAGTAIEKVLQLLGLKAKAIYKGPGFKNVHSQGQTNNSIRLDPRFAKAWDEALSRMVQKK